MGLLGWIMNDLNAGLGERVAWMGRVQRRSQEQHHQATNPKPGGCPTESHSGDSCLGQTRLQLTSMLGRGFAQLHSQH